MYSYATKETLKSEANDVIDVRMKASELKDESLHKIRFDVTAILNEVDKKANEKHYRLRLNEIVKGRPQPMIVQTEDAVYDPEKRSLTFPRVEFTSDQSLSSTPAHMKQFMIEIVDFDMKKPDKSRQFGRT